MTKSGDITRIETPLELGESGVRGGPNKRPAAAGVPRRGFALGALSSFTAARAAAGSAEFHDRVAGRPIVGDATAALQAAIDDAADRHRSLMLPRTVYRVRLGALQLRSHLSLIGTTGTTLEAYADTDQESAILSGVNLTDVRIQGITFVAPSDRVWALDFASCANIRVVKNLARVCSLVRFSAGSGVGYKHVTMGNCCHNVSVVGNVLEGPRHRKNVGGILISYTLGADVLYNRIKRHGHGIWWYGGDAGVIPGEGSRGSPRWVKDLRIEGNIVSDISSTHPNSGGGIWGGKGERIQVLRNTVSHCADIEIDFEGCVDCEAIENVVLSSNSAASLAIFFFCSDIRFVRNRVRRIAGGKCFGIFNAPQQFVETGPLIFERNVFECANGIGMIGASSAFLSFTFLQNKLQNVRIERSDYAVVKQEYRGNQLKFTIPSQTPFDALYSRAGGSMPGHDTQNIVVENVVSSTIAQPPGSRAIVVEDSDYSNDAHAEISSNETSGFSIDIVYHAGSDNDISKSVTIRDNLVEASIQCEEASASIGQTRFSVTSNYRKTGSARPDPLGPLGSLDGTERSSEPRYPAIPQNATCVHVTVSHGR